MIMKQGVLLLKDYGTQSGNMNDGAIPGVDGQFFIGLSIMKKYIFQDRLKMN